MSERKRRPRAGASYRQCEKAVREHVAWLMELPHVVGVGVCAEGDGFVVALYVEQAPSGADRTDRRPPPVLAVKDTGRGVPVRCFNTVGPIQLVCS